MEIGFSAYRVNYHVNVLQRCMTKMLGSEKM